MREVKHEIVQRVLSSRNIDHTILGDNLVPFSVKSISLNIAKQNWAGKPCVKAWLINNKIVYRSHIFHQ